MDQDQQWLINSLNATLDTNHQVRSYAEASLLQASLQSGFGSALSKIAANRELPLGSRQLAAVLLKQFIKKHWQEDEEGFEHPVVSSDEKAIIRGLLLSSLDDSHRKICTAISVAVASIAHYDWPEEWPELLPHLIKLINDQSNTNAVNGALKCLALLSADLDDKVVPILVPLIFPPLHGIVSSSQIYEKPLRTKALSVVYSCTSMLGVMSGVYKAETSALMMPMLGPWMVQFSSILELPVQSEDPDDWSIRMEVLKCLNQFVQNFPSLAETQFMEVLGPLWQTFVSSLRVYKISSIEGLEDAYDGRYDSDGSEKSLESFVIQLFEFLLTIVGSRKFVKVLGNNIQDLVYYCIAFLQMTEQQVKSLVDEAKTGSVNAIGNSSNLNAVGISPLPSLFPSGSAPPLSPRSTSGSPRFAKQKSSPSSLGSPLKLVCEPVREVIPQFYFQNGRPPPKEVKDQCLSRVDELFSESMDGLQLHEFKSVTKNICKLPSLVSTTLFRKIDANCAGKVTRDAFIKYWVDSNLLIMDVTTQIFKILKQPECEYLTQTDFKPILWELLATHPGLEFLQNTPEFQERYAETVIYRIFYYINRSGNGHLTLRELKRGNLIAAMQHADEEEDINKVLRYFSYEHFYVIYCKFWELDTDHDFLIDKENLSKYGNHTLTYRIVDRIFSQVPRKFTSNVEGKMGYEDFVYFMLAEEDKSSEPSLEYWFKCIDLDGNGILTANELQFFYEEQLHRMECMAQEPVPFEDILCQLVDMISPEKEGYITLHDFKECKLSSNVFNVLFNLNKFMAFESRDPFLIRQEREDPSLTEWDRFAHREYIRLSMEEDGEDVSNGSAEVWDESLEAPF